jgi:hypothetical protein
MHLSVSGSQAYIVCVHPAAWHASSVCVLVSSFWHVPTSVLQLYICVGAGAGVGGTHVAVQFAFVSVPDPAVHVLVVGSVHV